MNNTIRFGLIVLTLSVGNLQAEFKLLDQGAVVIIGNAGTTMITTSDVDEKLHLDGSKIPLSQQIKMEVVRQEVVASKMPIDENTSDKYLDNVRKVNNLTTQDLDDLALQCYRTLSEVKHLLNLQYVYDYFLYHKFRSHLVPTDQEVEEYHQKNPEIQPGYCVVEIAFVNFDNNNKKEVQDKINNIIAGVISDDILSWSDPISLPIHDIAADKLFITQMAVDEIVCQEDKDLFHLYRLVEKHDDYIIPLAQRKAFIVDILNRQQYEEMFRSYESHMLDNVGIINLLS